MRKEFLIVSSCLLAAILAYVLFQPGSWPCLAAYTVILSFGYYDFFQKPHTIRRNFPLLGRMRYLMEAIRPEINQYFVESETEGRPFSREERSLVYARAKLELETQPFGTIQDVYSSDFEWVNHSINPTNVSIPDLRVTIGGPQCSQPYSSSLINIGGMSYGSLGKNALCALNAGAKLGNFAHNTGEGGLSPYHKSGGGDLIWQLGTAYFGARDSKGQFCPKTFEPKARLDQIKMIEIKISQGAKPGHGGILPGKKLTEEIAEIRAVPMGHDVISPPGHSAFRTPRELLFFVQHLRELSGGKPIGMKLCIGKRREFLSICKAIESTGILPDYFAIDGTEGGTGAAPLEFANSVGSPGIEALIFVHNALVGFGLREDIRVINSGHVVSAFDVIKRIAIGADLVYMARAMMLALGCIQARRCNSNRCPTGITTNDPYLEAGLVPSEKKVRVFNFHKETIESVADLLGAMGLHHSHELKPWHIARRKASGDIRNYSEIFEYIPRDSLRHPKQIPESYQRAMLKAQVDSFA